MADKAANGYKYLTSCELSRLAEKIQRATTGCRLGRVEMRKKGASPLNAGGQNGTRQ
jgi:hypothetical protein